MKDIRVKQRTGVWWNILFSLSFVTIAPMYLSLYFAGKGLIILSDLLKELFTRITFKEIKK